MKPKLILATIALIVLFTRNNSEMALGSVGSNNHAFILELEKAQEMRIFEKEHTSRINFVRSVANQYNTAMPDSIISLVVEMSYEHNLSVKLICALITHESARTWNPEIVSPKGAIGLMQIMPITGKGLAKELSIKGFESSMLRDPAINIRLGCYFLSTLVTAYGVESGLAGYNGGEGRARLAHRGKYDQLPAETKKYVPGVMKIHDAYIL